MAGVFTDNQPDFSWLMLFEERSFQQYFIPYSEVGLVKNATINALVNLEIENEVITIKLYTTAEHKNAIVILASLKKIYFNKKIHISPDRPFAEKVRVDRSVNLMGVEIKLLDEKRKVLVNWICIESEGSSIPDPAKAVKEPSEISSIKQLYLTGLHIEQYWHAMYLPSDYYLEALRRESGDVRCNNALRLWFLRRGQFAKAESFFRKAIQTLVERNPNPYDGEPYFNLGWSLKMQNRLNETYDTLYKSVWNAEWQDAGYFSLAQIASCRGNNDDALDFVEKSLIKNWHNHKSRHLKSTLLRIKRDFKSALQFVDESLLIDKFNFGCIFEKYLLLIKLSQKDQAEVVLENFKKLIHGSVHTYIKYALDYLTAGLYDEASDILSIYLRKSEEVYPIVYYLFGFLNSLRGNDKSATTNYKKESSLKLDFCFPNRYEEVLVLQYALKQNPADAKAAYYLGNYWYANQQYEDALALWER